MFHWFFLYLFHLCTYSLHVTHSHLKCPNWRVKFPGITMASARGGMTSIPDVFSVSHSIWNRKMAHSVDEIQDLVSDYFVGFVDYKGD